MENVSKQRQNFISLPELGYDVLEFNFRKVHLHLTKEVSWNNCDKDSKNANALFNRRSRCRRVVVILKSLLVFFFMSLVTVPDVFVKVDSV